LARSPSPRGRHSNLFAIERVRSIEIHFGRSRDFEIRKRKTGRKEETIGVGLCSLAGGRAINSSISKLSLLYLPKWYQGIVKGFKYLFLSFSISIFVHCLVLVRLVVNHTFTSQ